MHFLSWKEWLNIPLKKTNFGRIFIKSSAADASGNGKSQLKGSFNDPETKNVHFFQFYALFWTFFAVCILQNENDISAFKNTLTYQNLTYLRGPNFAITIQVWILVKNPTD